MKQICSLLYLTSMCLIGGAHASQPGSVNAANARTGNKAVVLASPDRNIQVEFDVSAPPGSASLARYSVSYKHRYLIRQAALGLDLAPAGSLNNLRVLRVAFQHRDKVYRVFPGKTSQVRDHYEEATVSLEEQSEPHRRMELVFRAYDDGVAFRYRFPQQSALSNLTITQEHSTFAFVGNPRAYTLPLPSFTTPYEAYYQPVPLQTVSSKSLLALPLLLEYPDNIWVGITEADLTDYAGMYLIGRSDAPGTLESRLSPHPDNRQIAVQAALPHVSPWRVLMIADQPGKLIESNLITNLNPPCALKDTSWIKPGKTTFPWWNGYAVGDAAGFAGGLNTQTMKHYIDFCAEQGIAYHSLDGMDNVAWYGGPIVPYQGADITHSLPAIDLPGVIAYAHQKGVRLRLWMNVGAPRAHMQTAFPLYEKWGIEGVMVDFVERDDQEMINFIHDLVALAAKHHLTVTLHNISKPTGLSRTYPNLLTLESVYNLEYDKWDPVGSTPEHELIVPFTRMLAGPLDYHSGSFRNVTQQQFKPQNVAPVTIGSRARQIARYVVYEDYLPMVADYPAAYRGQPGLEFMTQIPTVWDETKVLNGEVGKYITIARRYGKQWYVGAMTDSSARNLAIPLRFLGSGHYTAEIYADDTVHADQPTHLLLRRQNVTAADTVAAALNPAGGYVLRLTPTP